MSIKWFLGFFIILIFLSGCINQQEEQQVAKPCTVSTSDLTAAFSGKGIDIYSLETYESDKVTKIKDADLDSIKAELSSLKSKCKDEEKVALLADVYSSLADELKQNKLLLIKSEEAELAITDDSCNLLQFKDDFLALYKDILPMIALKQSKLDTLTSKYKDDADIKSLNFEYLGKMEYFANQDFESMKSSFMALEEVCG
ncbi:MAG: hypothetical protein AABW72_05980 [archaeon]